MTLVHDNGCSADYARTLTDRIKIGVEACWHLIAEAYEIGAWSALGYPSWDDYTTREFGTARLRLPREDREEVVMSLRDAGLSLRAIAAVTGDSEPTVRRAVTAAASNDAPESDGIVDAEEIEPPARVKGVDNKSYPAKAPREKPRRNRFPSSVTKAGWELRRSVERVERIFADDRFPTYKEQVATDLGGHLRNVIEVCQDLLDQIN